MPPNQSISASLSTHQKYNPESKCCFLLALFSAWWGFYVSDSSKWHTRHKMV